MDVGIKVRNFREKLNMSRSDFSKVTGISASYLSEIERGIKNPTIEILQKICTAFDVTLSELLEETPSSPMKPEVKEISKTLSNFSTEDIKLLNEFLKSVSKRLH